MNRIGYRWGQKTIERGQFRVANSEVELAALVLNGVTSKHSKRAYAKGLSLFFTWVKERGCRAVLKSRNMFCKGVLRHSNPRIS